MKLNYIFIGLESDDYDRIDKFLVSNFDFQAAFFYDYLSKNVKKMKFEVNSFQAIMIRGRKKPSSDLVFKEHLKALEIEIYFDQDRYNQLYPFTNSYPLERLMKPVLKENEFNAFLFEMMMEGLAKAKKLNAPIPIDFLMNTVLDFKINNYKNEWNFKSKTFKEFSMKVYLFCKLDCNCFTLELVVEKNNNEVFRKDILKTLPSAIMYKGEFKDILIENEILKITKDDYEKSVLYELPLREIKLKNTYK